MQLIDKGFIFTIVWKWCIPILRWLTLMKMPKNQKVYHQVQRVGNPMILDLGKSVASSASLRKLCMSAPQNKQWIHKHLDSRARA